MYMNGGVCIANQGQDNNLFWEAVVGGGGSNVFLNSTRKYTTVPDGYTPSGYRIETVAKIIRAKNSSPARTFNNAKEFLVWLKNSHKK